VQLHVDFRGAIWSELNVVISGGTAEARRRTARLIHDFTHPRGARFLVVTNTSAARAQLRRITSPLHEPHPGTVFVEEVARLDDSTQARLLQWLDSSVGGALRVIAGTSTDLFARVTHAQFHDDLFYRLNTIQLRLEPDPVPVFG
jgi:DNA-binding NtrC family response regulator